MSAFEALTIIATLVFLEGILSIDNAAILGAMARRLPADQPVPWPPFIKPWVGPLDRLVGPQRTAALKVGLLGAYAGRGLMLILAAWVIQNLWLKLVGAAYLLKLGVEGLAVVPRQGESIDEHGHQVPVGASTFWSVVAAIELADLAFSLDNVVAAVALSSDLRIVMLGVALGIVTMRFAAGIFAWMIGKEPLLHRAAYMLVFVIAIEVFLDELAHLHVTHAQRFAISLAIIIGTVLYRRVPGLRHLDPVFYWIGVAFYYLDALTGKLLWPASLLLQGVQSVARHVAVPALRRVAAWLQFFAGAWQAAAEAIRQRLSTPEDHAGPPRPRAPSSDGSVEAGAGPAAAEEIVPRSPPR
ncbi:MAG: tellurium resistance protein TerC [Chloroflexota bacterium]